MNLIVSMMANGAKREFRLLKFKFFQYYYSDKPEWILEKNGIVVINELTGLRWLRRFMNWWFKK